MSVRVGAGWELAHLTDRVVELRKDDPVYRRLIGHDGFVRVRAEPGMDRNGLIDKAVKMAQRNDEEVSRRVAKQLMPSVVSLAKYRREQRRLAPAFGVPGHEPEQRRYRP